MKKSWPALAVALVIGASSHSRAEVSLKDVRWGFRPPLKMHMHNPTFVEAKEWVQPPSIRATNLPRVAVTLVNRGPLATEGVVLRYALSAEIVSIKKLGSKGEWVLPFWVDRRRVPFLKSNQILEIQINPTDEMRLATSLREMYRAGFWPDAIKIEIMVEPRVDEEMSHKISEKILPVVWQPANK